MSLRKTIALALSFAMISVSAQAGLFDFFSDDVKGDGNIKTETRSVKEYKSIHIAGAINLVGKVGSDYFLSITTDSNIIPLIKTEVEDGVLEIDSDKSYDPSDKVVIEITAPTLEAVKVAGATKSQVTGLKGESFVLEVAGAGDVTLQGQVKSLEANIAGAGEIRAKELVSDSVEIKVAGAGDAVVSANQKLKASIAGAGKVVYFGNPEKVDQQILGAGSIQPGK